MMGKLYCAFCGKEAENGAENCAACGKKIPAKENLFLDFLLDHTKDSIKGKIEDSVYETIKNFLLSHLYGVVVGISLIVVGAVAVISPNPYSHIEKVGSLEEARTSVSETAAVLSEADKQEIQNCISKYVASLDSARFMAGNDAFMYAISDDLYYSLENEAEYSLYYNYYDEEIFPYVRAEDMPTNVAEIHKNTLSAESKTAIGTELKTLGYEIATFNMTPSLYAKNVNPETPVAKRDYLVTFAKENGQWLLVETVELAEGGK